MTVACPDCGAQQRIPPLAPRTLAKCLRCGKLLDQADGWSLAIGLIWTLTALLLLLPANLLPLMRASVLGISREIHISSGVTGLWADGWPILGVMFGALTIVIPFLWSGLTTLVLTMIHLHLRPSWLGRAFRYAEAMRLWAMPDVLVLAGFVIYMRTSTQLQAQLTAGGWCLIAAVVLGSATSMFLSRHDVWRAIMPDRPTPSDESAISCITCNLILPISDQNRPCPRCGRHLHRRRPDAMSRTAALVVASYILYFPSYYYPMSMSVRPDGVQEHTIIDGVNRLVQAGFWPLAVIVFIASVLIPLLKLIGLTWLLVRIRHPSKRHLMLRMRVYRMIHKVGRWSSMDPFIIALTVPLLSFRGITVHVGNAALPFILVVVLTMLAVRTFDARLEWDAVEARL